MKFDNQELIQYDDSYFGKGKGVIVGYFQVETEGIEYYVIYPKTPFDKSFWPYMTFVLPEEKLISTPF